MSSGAEGSRFWSVLGLILALGLLLRTGYVVAQPASDPTFLAPSLDGEHYLDWARRIAPGHLGVDGVPYLAPGYPLALAAIFGAIGERLLAVALLQQIAVLAGAALAAVWARRRAGELAGWAAAALLTFQHATIFFAGRLAAESLFVLPALGALVLVDRAPSSERRSTFAIAGVLCGLSALGRPNLLALPVLWCLWLALRRRFGPALLLLAGTLAILAPLTLRNAAVSGSFVPVSSNAGITAFHGNGPGARGVYTRPEGFSGRLSTQREEALELARVRSGDPGLDALAADRWWGGEALRTRLADPVDTLALGLRRIGLVLDSRESALGAHPGLDTNPWRATWRVAGDLPWIPFGLLAGLALAGVIARPRAVGAPAWLAIAGAAAAPLLFYVSSRYRLPLTIFLCLPAGVGVAVLWARPAAKAIGAGALLLIFSFVVPNAAVHRAQRAGALANLAAAYERMGGLEAAEREARRAVELDPGAVVARFNLGRILERTEDVEGAERQYREAHAIDPSVVEPALNLAALLVRSGRAAEADAPLERALASHPRHTGLWTNRVVAAIAAGRLDTARRFAEDARAAGVALDPELLATFDEEVR